MGQYRVYLVRFKVAFADPDMPQPRYHTGIFVETRSDGGGFQHHVIGDVTSAGGMTYDHKQRDRPEYDSVFHSKDILGTTESTNYPDAWNKLLCQLPPPLKQKHFNSATGRTEPFKSLSPLTFYEVGEPRRPLTKCTEWVLNQAVPSLKSAGLIAAAV